MVCTMAKQHQQPQLAEDVPEHGGEAEADDEAQDHRVAPLPEVDPLHQVVDHWELVRYVVELRLNSLEICSSIYIKNNNNEQD